MRLILTILTVLMAVVIGSIYSQVHPRVKQYAPIVKTENTTFKKDFLASCQESATSSQCECGYSALVTLYGEDWDSEANKAVITRIEGGNLTDKEYQTGILDCR